MKFGIFAAQYFVENQDWKNWMSFLCPNNLVVVGVM
jgi:hypothetical protein